MELEMFLLALAVCFFDFLKLKRTMETPGPAVPNRRRGRCKRDAQQACFGERKPVDGETSGGENKSCRGDKKQSSQSVSRWNILGTRPYQTIIKIF